MDDINKVEAVSERDIDLLLLEELNVSDEFSAWFHSKVTQSSETVSIKDAWHSISDPILGESDLVAVYNNGLAILIENKINAIAQPTQGKRYEQRGIKGIENAHWTSFRTCMIAPILYLQKEQDAAVYDSTLSYEEISEWFISKRDQRSKYKGYLLNEAIEQNRRGYTIVPSESVTEFWSKYWILSIQQYPELEMKKPGLKPANSDWPDFRPSTLDKRFSIVHKLARGDVDLQITGASESIDELAERLSNHAVEVVQAGKSAAIRIQVDPIDRSKPFDAQKDSVLEGLNAAKVLLRIGQEIMH